MLQILIPPLTFVALCSLYCVGWLLYQQWQLRRPRIWVARDGLAVQVPAPRMSLRLRAEWPSLVLDRARMVWVRR